MARRIHIEKSIPPRLRENAPLVFATPKAMGWLDPVMVDKLDLSQTDETPVPPYCGMHVEVAPFLKEGAGFTCSYMRTDQREAPKHRWFLGVFAGDELLCFLWESTILRALLLV